MYEAQGYYIKDLELEKYTYEELKILLDLNVDREFYEAAAVILKEMDRRREQNKK